MAVKSAKRIELNYSLSHTKQVRWGYVNSKVEPFLRVFTSDLHDVHFKYHAVLSILLQ